MAVILWGVSNIKSNKILSSYEKQWDVNDKIEIIIINPQKYDDLSLSQTKTTAPKSIIPTFQVFFFLISQDLKECLYLQ